MKIKCDCRLIFKGEPVDNVCRASTKAKLPAYYIGYFLRLGKPDIRCVTRKTHHRPPTTSDRRMLKSMIKNPGYIQNIMDYLHQCMELEEGEAPPEIMYGPMRFTLHDLQCRTSIKDFIENADINRVFGTIEAGGL